MEKMCQHGGNFSERRNRGHALAEQIQRSDFSRIRVFHVFLSRPVCRGLTVASVKDATVHEEMTTSLPASTGRSGSRAMLIQDGRYSRDWGCSREWGCLRERRMSRGEPTARTEPISKLCTGTRPVTRTRLSRKRNRRCDLGRQIFTHTCKFKNF